METYKFLEPDNKKKFDAMVLGLMLRGKNLLEAVKITEFSFQRKIFGGEKLV